VTAGDAIGWDEVTATHQFDGLVWQDEAIIGSPMNVLEWSIQGELLGLMRLLGESTPNVWLFFRRAPNGRFLKC